MLFGLLLSNKNLKKHSLFGKSSSLGILSSNSKSVRINWKVALTILRSPPEEGFEWTDYIPVCPQTFQLWTLRIRQTTVRFREDHFLLPSQELFSRLRESWNRYKRSTILFFHLTLLRSIRSLQFLQKFSKTG
jgi:hypothetical protein